MTMCGICGFVRFNGVVTDGSETLHRMTAALGHRGPDDSGYYVGGCYGRPASVLLGHTRLKVIDLTEAASQPLANEDETVFVVFNGEIYNFSDLRRRLAADGHRFRSASDTEVIVHAYEQFGDDFVRHLDGMFAFALWDTRRNALVLARDRTGKKPLYYSFNGDVFVFASEIKAIMVCPWIERRVSVDTFAEYFTFGYVGAPRTMYEGISQLAPASCLVFENNTIRGPDTYWRLDFPPEGREESRPIDAVKSEIRELVVSAVHRRLISDVPLGVLLSGGLDSSIVVGVMRKLSGSDIRTFSIGFEGETSFDERPYAARVAKHFGTRHTEFVVKIEPVELMEKLLWHYDQPYGDSAAIPTYLVSKMARQFVTVALNGDGGDEVFGGYERFRAALFCANIPAFVMKAGAYFTGLMPRNYGYYSPKRRLERFFSGSNNGTVMSRYLDWISIFNGDMLRELISRGGDIYDLMERRLKLSENASLLNRMLHFNFITYLPGDLNTKMDRMSMAHGLETRSPFLDTGLIEYVARIGPRLKIKGGCTKRILRLAFKDMLPAGIIKRKKHGFGMPLGLWFKDGLGDCFSQLLLSDACRAKQFLNPDYIGRIFREHQQGSHDHGYRLWTLLQFEMWLRMLEKPPTWRPGEAIERPTEKRLVQTGKL
ncbi:MAG: asparagine synthase (glutamine-hydrolyzing) [Sedimentisphaerales bacterium]|nr:asparagine synthase (glutamine-hydrolyzing) [Sedimentisphaerales bacterium]